MKKITLLIIGIIISGFVFSQTIIFSDNFDSYTVGQGIASQSSNWETWSSPTGGADDALISNTQSSSPTNSINIINDKDIVYKFGDLSTGSFDIEFNFFIASGFGAYLNIEHDFANNWAFEIFFKDNNQIWFDNGTDSLQISTYSHNTWHNLLFQINITDDILIINLDGVLVNTYAFSISNSGTTSNILDCINFYGLNNNYALYGFSNSNWFVDDFTVTEIVPALTLPVVNINITEITTNGSSNEVFSVTNEGEADMSYRAYPVYDNHTSFSGTDISDSITHCNDILELYAGLGWDAGDTLQFVSRFYHEHTNSLIGLKIDSIQTNTQNGSLNNSAKIVILDRGEFTNTNNMGNLLYHEEFTNIPSFTYYNFPLTTPFTLTGEELSYGLSVTSKHVDSLLVPVEWSDPSVYEPFCNYRSWDGSYIEYQYNIYLKAFVSGFKWPQWLSVSPMNGIIAGGSSEDLTITFNTTDLQVDNIYTAKIVFACNDENTEFTDIPITLDILSGINENDKIGVISYPNPTTDVFYITADSEISNVKVFSQTGQILKEMVVSSKSIKIDISDLSCGVYYAKININDKVITKKIIKE